MASFKKLISIIASLLIVVVVCVVSVILLLIPWFNSYNTIFDVFGNIAIFFMGLSSSVMLINGLFTGWHFDQMFKANLLGDKNIGNKIYAPGLSGKYLVRLRFARANLYAFCIVFPKWASRLPAYRGWFRGYDFRKNARWEDVLISYVFFVCVSLFVWLAVIAFIIKMFVA